MTQARLSTDLLHALVTTTDPRELRLTHDLVPNVPTSSVPMDRD